MNSLINILLLTSYYIRIWSATAYILHKLYWGRLKVSTYCSLPIHPWHGSYTSYRLLIAICESARNRRSYNGTSTTKKKTLAPMEKTFNFNGTPNRQPIVLQTTIVLTWLSWLYYSTLLHNNINIEAFQNPSYTTARIGSPSTYLRH